MNATSPSGEPSTSSQGTKPLSILFQILALVFGCAAVFWGVFWVYEAAFPGPCGDNGGPGLGVIESWVTNVPLGLAILAVGWFVKKGLPRLRRICIVASILTLFLPAVASILLLGRHCP